MERQDGIHSARFSASPVRGELCAHILVAQTTRKRGTHQVEGVSFFCMFFMVTNLFYICPLPWVLGIQEERSDLHPILIYIMPVAQLSSTPWKSFQEESVTPPPNPFLSPFPLPHPFPSMKLPIVSVLVLLAPVVPVASFFSSPSA